MLAESIRLLTMYSIPVPTIPVGFPLMSRDHRFDEDEDYEEYEEDERPRRKR